ncbi:MAG TPA: RNA methyltransferase [Chloroflexi bacterium]|nr:RNA methyltransferase [Chloroflexota bacterium]
MSDRIRSRRNPKVQHVRRLLRSARVRREVGQFVAEGVRLAEEALAAGWQPVWVLFSDDIGARGQAVVEAFRQQGVPVFAASPEVMQAASATETPQGVLLVLPLPPPRWPDDADFLLVLDGVRDPGNVGTMLRTAWAAGVQGVLLSPDCADPFNPKVVRAGMGAHFHLPLRRAPWEALLPLLEGKARFLAAGGEGVPYTTADFRQPLALIVGGEAHGAGQAARQAATQVVHIPMPGAAESLNAAVAAAVLMFEVVRQRR